MEFTVQKTAKGVCLVRVTGPLNIYEAARFKQGLVGIIRDAASYSSVEVDLSEVSELDTTGVQLLVSARREAYALGKGLRVTAASAAAVLAFDVYNLKGFLE